ncbi:MAG TPA: MarR family transcriptional regulator [Pseudonocardiaceae bacterium]|nr:MarR family transcriptional regulator [Pseudonocardiaceae bacterium]
MGSTQSDAQAPRPTPEEVEAVMLATRVLVAVTAQSVASVEDQVTLPQLRVLVMIASRGPQNLASVAQALGVHPSNATRRCDRLVDAGLIHRSDDPTDRRNLVLQLTPSGWELVEQMVERRRAALENVLAKMPATLRGDLVPALLAFAEAAGEIPPSEAWALGWPTDQPDCADHHMPSGTPR